MTTDQNKRSHRGCRSSEERFRQLINFAREFNSLLQHVYKQKKLIRHIYKNRIIWRSQPFQHLFAISLCI